MASNKFAYDIEARDKSKAATQSAQRNMGNMESSARKLGNTLKTAFTATAILAVGKAVINVANDLQQAYAVQERAERKLAAAVSANPMLDGGAAKRLQEFASELQSVTTIGDEVTIDLAAMATTWGRNEEEIRQLITASANLSEALGIDLKMAARGVNNIMEGNIQTLSRYIPELRTLTDEQIASGEAMELIERRFGGMAEAMRDTTEGSLKSFANAWGDLKEELGRSAADAMQPTRDFFRGLIEDFTDSLAALNDFKDAMLDIQKVWSGEIDITQVSDIQRYIDTLDAQQQNLQRDLQSQRQLRDTLIEQGKPQYLISAAQQAVTAMMNQLSIVGDEMGAAIAEQIRRELDEQNRKAAVDAAGAGGGGGSASPFAGLGAAIGKMASGINGLVTNEFGELGGRITGVNTGLDTTGVMFGNLNLGTDKLIEHIKNTGSALEPLGEYSADAAQAIRDHADAADEARRRMERNTPQGAGASTLPNVNVSNPATGGDPGLQGMLAAATGPIGALAAVLIDLGKSFEVLVQLTAPLKAVFDGIVAVMGPIINEGFAPLVGMLNFLGQIIGRILLPVFQPFIWGIQKLGEAFVWLYNKVFVPVHNFFKTIGNKIYNAMANMVNWVIGILNKLPGVNIATVSTRSPDAGHIGEISFDDLTSTGLDTSGATGTGAGASYTTGRNITVNIDIFSEIIAGEGGIRDLSLMIRDEIRSAEALGA